jgi:thioredoxin-dependent peroxiredoxin
MLEIGKKAPAFNIPDQTGTLRTLKDLAGKWVLVYFYPRDMTPGCTKEACLLRDSMSALNELNAVVLGVSKDSPESHVKFIKKEKLNFDLLSDESTKMIQKYGAWQQKSMFGNKYMGIQRMSYLIDPKGKIAKVYPRVSPAKHAKEVLKDLEELA